MADTAVATLPEVSKPEERALIKAGAQRWTKAEVAALRELCCPKDATPSEILSFWYVAKRTGLDPFARQIYLVRYGKGEGEEGTGRATIQIGIDGFRQVSMETPGFAGLDEPEFEGEGTEKDKAGNEVKHPLICRVRVYRMLEGHRVTFTGVARWREFAKRFPEKDSAGKPTGKKYLGSMWASMPYNQLSKCAEVQAHRKSAPMRLSGVYAPEELGTVIDVVGTPVAMPQPTSRPAISHQAGGSSSKGEVKTGKDLWNAIMDDVGGNPEEAQNLLERLTTFVDKDQKTVKGVRDYQRLSDAWAKRAYQRFQELAPRL